MTERYKSRASTHADDCWAWGPGHYECAVGKIGKLVAELKGMNTERLRLRDEVDAMREDAERYRWLRDGGLVVLPYDFPYHEELDAVIDLERAKENGND